MKILLVEDDDKSTKALTKSLKPHRYILDVVKDGEAGWVYGSTFEYDLIVLDIVLPKLDGISLCKRFRTEGFITPIILLTSQDTITAKVQGLDAGADDYVVKPFDQAELISRIRALLRRSSTNPLPLLTWGDLLLNLNTCEVSYNGIPLTLSKMEYELLELLLRDSQHVYSTDELLERLWSSEQFPSEATVRSHIRRLRHKLVSVGAPKDFVATVYGRGYYLKAPTTEESTGVPTTLTKSENSLSSEIVTFADKTPSIKLSQTPEGQSPLLVVVSSDSEINQSLLTVAENHGIRIQLVPIPAENASLISLESSAEQVAQPPNAILFQLPSHPPELTQLNQSFPHSRSLWELWRTFTRLYPEAPLLVMGERGELSDRIQATRWGAKLFLEAQTPPEENIEAIIQFLERFNMPKKVMVLDDDQDWLCTLPSLLKPWGFKVTTLADPQQFWTVLQAVIPDALVLGVNLPQINGFEVCQLLRSDPHWHPLPILFLSTLGDSTSQQQAFKVGADDYLCKPVMGAELANRLLNRLQRVRARAD